MEYHIIAFGCQFNKSDAEKISQLLAQKGYKQSHSPQEADLLVVLMCSVRQKAVNKVYNLILNLKSKISNPHLKSKNLKEQKIILTGCILEADKKQFGQMGVEIKNFRDLEKFPPLSGLIVIGKGCNNFCSYCVVPYTRGREKYRSQTAILKDAKTLIKKGVKEITLVAQNVNSYKYKLKTQNSKLKATAKNLKLISFAELLRKINELPGDFKIRFLTNHPKDMSAQLIKTIAECEKVEKYIHLPIQSGDNEILKKMNRKYTRENYLALVKKIKKAIPDVKITTDIIVGFPGETKKAFRNTVELFKKVGFHQAYIAKYSPRPGTAAFKLKDNVPPEEKKWREQVLRNLID